MIKLHSIVRDRIGNQYLITKIDTKNLSPFVVTGISVMKDVNDREQVETASWTIKGKYLTNSEHERDLVHTKEPEQGESIDHYKGNGIIITYVYYKMDEDDLQPWRQEIKYSQKDINEINSRTWTK